jgi:hypothetical protein
LYIDNNPANNSAADTVYLGSKFFTKASGNSTITDGEKIFNSSGQQLLATDAGKTIYIVYKTAAGCFTQTASFVLGEEIILNPTPVRFISFTAARQEDKVFLNWETATEEINKGFYVQRSIAGSAWQEVGFLPSQAAGGNSTSNLAYSFTDINPAIGITRYRLLQVDLDGKSRYGEIRTVRGREGSGKLLLFPNPSSTGAVTLMFNMEGSKDVMVTDMAGRMIRHYKHITAESLEITALPSGMYTVQVRDAGTRIITIEKFIIRR